MNIPTVSAAIACTLASSLIAAIPANAEDKKAKTSDNTVSGSEVPTNRPPSQEIINMARTIEFDKIAVTDEPVSPEIKQLNTSFFIKVFYRTRRDSPGYLPEQGAVLARVAIGGVPVERNLPDGEYYLWIGRGTDSLRAFLIKIDGKASREVEVLPRPMTSLSEVSVEPSNKVRSLVLPLSKPTTSLAEESSETSSKFRSVALPLPGTPPRPPQPPPPRRTWREIWVPVPKTDHQGGGRWIRVPDN